MVISNYTKFIFKNFYNNKNKNLTIKNSIKKNALSWIFISIIICIISYENVKNGVFTFIFFIFVSYFYHVYIHLEKNLFTIIHHYHHENDNVFSHIIQLLLELSISYPYMLLNFFFNINIFNKWIIIFFLLFYSSVHNINYGYFKINNVHKLHHKKYYKNFGPDICDVIFGTKHKLEQNVENTNHYIPNTLLCGLIVYLIKYLYISNAESIYKLTFIVSSLMYLFLVSTSIYLYIYDFTKKHIRKEKYRKRRVEKVYKKAVNGIKGY